MKFISLLSALALASAVYADCSALGPGATDTVSTPFQLVAASASGTQSQLSLVNFLTVPHTGFHVLSTATGPGTPWLGLTMAGGTITAIPPNANTSPAQSIGNLAVDGTHFPPLPGPWPTFSNTFAPPPNLFCSVPDAQGRNVLALLGRTDLFSLCRSFMSQQVTTNALLFNSSSSAFGDGFPSYDGSSCQDVTVLLASSA